MIIYTPWESFKNIVFSKSLLMQYYETDNTYEIYAFDDCYPFHTRIYKDAASLNILGVDTTVEEINKVDFETNYKSDCNKKNETIFRIEGFRNFEKDLYHKAFKYNVVANTTNEYSESFDVDVYLSGGMYEVIGDVNDGDYVEFSVTDEDNVLGYGAGFVVSKFLEKEYVNPDRKYRQVMSEDAALIPSSLYLTLTYHSAGANEPKVIIRYIMRK